MALLDRALADEVVTIRTFDPSDQVALLSGRDAEFHRLLGETSSEPAPVACICVDATIVGWIDYDGPRRWLDEDEVNVGYNIFPSIVATATEHTLSSCAAAFS